MGQGRCGGEVRQSDQPSEVSMALQSVLAELELSETDITVLTVMDEDEIVSVQFIENQYVDVIERQYWGMGFITSLRAYG